MKKLLSILLIIGFLAGGVFLGYATQPSQYVINAGDARWHTKLNAGLDALWNNITAFSTLITNWAIEDNMVTLITATPTYSNGTTFTVPGDYTSRLTTGKVVQVRLAATTVETTVASSTYTSPNTTVVLTDSVLTNPITRVYVVAARDGLWPNGPGYVVAADYGTDQAALVTADGLAVAAGKQLVIGRAFSITTDCTLASNLKVMPVSGGAFPIATTKTLTINGPLEAGLYQIFSCTGTGKVMFGAGVVNDVYSEWFGAKNDGTSATATTAAINAAVQSLPTNGKLAFSSSGTYLFDTLSGGSAYSVNLDKAGMIVAGNGAWIKFLDSTGYGNGSFHIIAEDVVIQDLNFDMSGWTTAGVGNYSFAIASDATTGKKATVTRCTFKDSILYRVPIRFDGEKAVVSFCRFTNTGGGFMLDGAHSLGCNNIADGWVDTPFVINGTVNIGSIMSGNTGRNTNINGAWAMTAEAGASNWIVANNDIKTVQQCFNAQQTTEVTETTGGLLANNIFESVEGGAGSGSSYNTQIDPIYRGTKIIGNTFIGAPGTIVGTSQVINKAFNTMWEDNTFQINRGILGSINSMLELKIPSTFISTIKGTIKVKGNIFNNIGGCGYGIFDNTGSLNGLIRLNSGGNEFINLVIPIDVTAGILVLMDGTDVFTDCTTALYGHDLSYYFNTMVPSARWFPYKITEYNKVIGVNAIPTTGTWAAGDEAIQVSGVAGGASDRWRCITSGTFSAYSDSGTATDTSPIIIAVGSTAGVRVGDYVSVSAKFPTTGPYRVVGKTATTLTLDTNANASGATNITTPDPVFKAGAVLIP